MPSIPVYEQQTSVGGGFSAPRADPEEFGAGIGRGLGVAAQGLDNLAIGSAIENQRKLREQDQRVAKSWSGPALTGATLDWDKDLTDRMAKATPGDPDLYPQVMADFKTYSTKLIDSAPTQSAKDLAQYHMNTLADQVGKKTIAFDAANRVTGYYNNATTAITNGAKVVQQNPESYGTMMQVIQQTMPDVGPQNVAKLTELAKHEMTTAAASHWLDADPKMVRDATGKALGVDGFRGNTGVPWVDDATPEQVRAWNNAAEAKIAVTTRATQVRADAQASKTDGVQAYTDAVQLAPLGPPKNVGAPDVKVYDQGRIDRVAAFVKAPSEYDGAIADAAKKYGVSPLEIKLKIGVESGGNPAAVNPQGGHGDHATGLGQFTAATAARYGITDRTDPIQSINGIAQMLAANGGTVGGDMSKADRAYFGGNVNAKGPNTDQYVENTGAVRRALIGGAPMPTSTAQLEQAEQVVLDRADALAEQSRPGDAVYRDKVRNEAHAYWAKAVQVQRGQDYANFSGVLDAAIKGGATTLTDLPPAAQETFSKLSPQNVLGIQAQFDRNLRAANGEFTKSDPTLVNDLTRRLYLPDGDPKKLTYPGQLSEFMGRGLNYSDQQHLITQMKEANTPEGNPFLKQANGVKETARKMLTTSMSSVAIAHPEMAEEAAYRFGIDLDQKIKAARAGKLDPQQLFVPGSKDYVLDPSRVAAFMPTEGEIAARKTQAAAAPIKAAPAPVQRMPGESPADYLARIRS